MLTPFHSGVQLHDIAEARDFHGRRLALPEGRSSEHRIDLAMAR